MNKLALIVGMASLLISCQLPAPVAKPTVSYEVIPVTMNVPESQAIDSLRRDTTAKKQIINSNGMFYALPRQRVEVDIVVKKQEFIKGTYSEFAEKLLGVKSAIKSNYNVYSIENVSVSQKSEIDPKRVYFTRFNDSDLALEYDKGMIISGVNTFKNKQSAPIKKDSPQNLEVASDKNTQNQPDLYIDPWIERVDTIVSDQVVDTQMIQNYEIRVVKTEKTPLQKAEEIVENISKIREDRDKLLTGYQETNYNINTFKFMFEQFNRMEDEYIRLFTGNTKTSYETVRFEFLPEEENLTTELVGFSKSNGLISSVSAEKKVMLSITPSNDESAMLIENFSKNIQRKKDGFYYVIPNQCFVKVSLDNHTLFSKLMPFSQFGFTRTLAPDMLEIEYLPATGELRSVKALK